MCCLLDDSHSFRCEVILSLWFERAFPWWRVMLTIFSCVFWPSVYILWKQVPSSANFLIGFLFFWRLTCVNEFLVYFVYEPLTRYIVCKYFSHSVGCLFFCGWFPLLLESLSVGWSPIGLFCLRRQIQKVLLRLMAKSVLPMFSSRSFMASGLTLKYLIHSEVIL